MKLSKETRNKIYKEIYWHPLLKHGICLVINMVFHDLELATNQDFETTKERMKALPELWDKKPEGLPSHTHFYWFPLDMDGFALRRFILEKCIQETSTNHL